MLTLLLVLIEYLIDTHIKRVQYSDIDIIVSL